ncbi:MAG: hypothetical protein ACHQ3O_12700, partial [Candidatus Limnocylindria bacterium]
MRSAASLANSGARFLATSGLALALACQSGPPAKAPARSRESPFPSPAELSKLPPAPAKLSMPEFDEVDAWTLAGPFPERVETAPHEPASAFEGVLADAVAERAGLALVSESMHCMAREIGRFLLERHKPPPSSLMEYMAARCGAVGADFRPAWYQGEIPSGVSDEALLAKWRPEIESLLRNLLSGGGVASG